MQVQNYNRMFKGDHQSKVLPCVCMQMKLYIITVVGVINSLFGDMEICNISKV